MEFDLWGVIRIVQSFVDKKELMTMSGVLGFIENYFHQGQGYFISKSYVF